MADGEGSTRREFLMMTSVAAGSLLVAPRADAAVPIRFPHESVAWSAPVQDAGWTLHIKGGGLTQQAYNFANVAVRPLLFEWVPAAAPLHLTHVRTVVRSLALNGAQLAVGQPIPNNAAATFEFATTARNYVTTWRAWQHIPRTNTKACFVPYGCAPAMSWFGPALAGTSNSTVETLLRIAANYIRLNIVMYKRWANFCGVFFQALPTDPTGIRPSFLVTVYDPNRTADQRLRIDALQDLVAWQGAILAPGGELMPVAESTVRWRAFMTATTIQAGIAEYYALGIVTGRPATSAPIVLAEAAHDGASIVTLNRPSDITLIHAYDTPTRVKIEEALAAGAKVVVPRFPVQSVSGWVGTPWFAYNRTNEGTLTNAGTYLNTMRGGAGQFGPTQPGTMTQDEATAIANSTVAHGLGIAAVGGVIALTPFGPTAKVAGLAVAVVGGVVAVTGMLLHLTISLHPPSPKQGHVDIDEGATGVASSGGDGAGDGPGLPGTNPTSETAPSLGQSLSFESGGSSGSSGSDAGIGPDQGFPGEGLGEPSSGT